MGNYAIFGGGYYANWSTFNNVVMCYDTSLIKSYATNLSVARGRLAAASIGNYAIFAGGLTSGNTASNAVDAYDTSLVKTNITSLRGTYNGQCRGASIENYFAYFVGSNSEINDTYNTSLTRSEGPSTISSNNGCSGCSGNNNYIITYRNYSASPRGYAFNRSLTTTSLGTSINHGYGDLDDCSVGKYAMFVGGSYPSAGGSYYHTVSIYDGSLTRTETSLSEGRTPACATVANFAVCAGGYNGNSYTKITDVFDSGITRSNPGNLSYARGYHAGASNAKYAVFTGGYSSGIAVEITEAYYAS